MFEDFIVGSLDSEAFWACKNQFFKNFFDHSMYVAQWVRRIADPTCPLPFGRYLLRTTLVAIDLITLGTFLRLEDDKATYFTHEMVNYIWQLRRHECRRLYIHLHFGLIISNENLISGCIINITKLGFVLI